MRKSTGPAIPMHRPELTAFDAGPLMSLPKRLPKDQQEMPKRTTVLQRLRLEPKIYDAEQGDTYRDDARVSAVHSINISYGPNMALPSRASIFFGRGRREPLNSSQPPKNFTAGSPYSP
jgi:hypothetical protein